MHAKSISKCSYIYGDTSVFVLIVVVLTDPTDIYDIPNSAYGCSVCGIQVALPVRLPCLVCFLSPDLDDNTVNAAQQ